jgi:quinoprotein dehydrogenase-associated probable ABC transporter substrate-binding protein
MTHLDNGVTAPATQRWRAWHGAQQRRPARWALAFAALICAFGAQAQGEQTRPLRVCADPGNMPLSNQKLEGYQNKMAQVLAEGLGTSATFDWRASTERGLLRGTLDANMCDVMFDIPAGMERVLTTRPLYRSSFVLAYRQERNYNFKNLDDPRLKKLSVGVYQMSSVREALAQHGIKTNTVTHFISYDGDRVPQHQPSYQVQRMVDGQIDVVAIWGPFAGFYKTLKGAPIVLQPVNLWDDHEPMEFDMSLAVRRGDVPLQQALDRLLVEKKDALRKILDEYGVPLVQCDSCVISGSLPAHGPYRERPQQQLAGAEPGPEEQGGVSLAQLKEWLKQGANPNAELSNAATAGDLVRVKYLVENGADINTRDFEGYTPLLNAVRTKYDDLSNYLVEHGADVNLADRDGWTPLMFAAWRNSVGSIEALIRKGARLEDTNPKGLTALSIAAQHGKTEALVALMTAGGDIEHKSGAGAYTPLMLAVAGGWEDAARQLLEHGAQVNARNAGGLTTLMIAAAGNRADTVQLLLRKGADVEARDEEGMTALSIAQQRDNQDVIELLNKTPEKQTGALNSGVRVPKA